MSNNRYVILNCPTLMGNRLCYSKTIKQCTDCTDCVLKQIVELCKKNIDFCKKCSVEADYQYDCIDCTQGGRAELGYGILNLLDIQEVE